MAKKRWCSVELAAEQDGQQVAPRLRLAAREHVLELRQPRGVVRSSCGDALAMPRNGRPCEAARACRRAAHQTPRAIQEERQRIAVGIDWPHADIGGDARQQHVAGDQHAAPVAVQRRVLGRVTVARRSRASAGRRRERVAGDHAVGTSRGSSRHAARDRDCRAPRSASRRSRRGRARGKRAGSRERVRRALVEAACAVRNSACVIASGQSKRSAASPHCRRGRDGSGSRRCALTARRRRVARSCAPTARAWCRREPQSTIVQASPSSSSQRLMWSSANGSGMRSQWTPGATSCVARAPAARDGDSRGRRGAGAAKGTMQRGIMNGMVTWTGYVRTRGRMLHGCVACSRTRKTLPATPRPASRPTRSPSSRTSSR